MNANNAVVEAGEPMPLFRALRIVRDKSGAEISFISTIDRSRLSVLENGFAPPRPHEREKLARALNVSPDQVDQRVRLFVEMPPRRVEAAAQPVRRRQRAESKGIPAEE